MYRSLRFTMLFDASRLMSFDVKLLQTISNHFKLLQTISNYLKLSQTISNYLKPFFILCISDPKSQFV